MLKFSKIKKYYITGTNCGEVKIWNIQVFALKHNLNLGREHISD
jgi:hypothetical protein